MDRELDRELVEVLRRLPKQQRLSAAMETIRACLLVLEELGHGESVCMDPDKLPDQDRLAIFAAPSAVSLN